MGAQASNSMTEPLLEENTATNENISIDFSSNNVEDIQISSQGFTPFIAACFTVNYLVGTGFLTLPWAFAQAGLILSTIMLIIATGLSDIVKDFLLEAMARAELVVPYDKESIPKESQNNMDVNLEPLIVKERKFEVSDLSRIFLGNRTSLLFVSLLALSSYFTLWAYTVVFISVLLDELSLTDSKDIDAAIYVGVYAVIVVPLSCLNLKEQVWVQVSLSVGRVFMLVFMVTTTLLFPDEFRNTPFTTNNTDGYTPAPLFRVDGIAQCLPIILFALGFQIAIPGISQATAIKHTPKLGRIFRSAFLFCAVSYILVGITAALAAGETVAQSSNVMWKSFRGGTGELSKDGEYINVAIWAKVISYFVVMFPAVDVISAFPLNAIVLGSNLSVAIYRGERLETSRKRVIMFRLLSSVPPLFGALFIRKLGIVTDYAGTVFFILNICYPSLIYIYSKSEKGTTQETVYKSWGTNTPFAIFAASFGFLMFLYLVIDYSFIG